MLVKGAPGWDCVTVCVLSCGGYILGGQGYGRLSEVLLYYSTVLHAIPYTTEWNRSGFELTRYAHSSPLWASYGLSLVSTLDKRKNIWKVGFDYLGLIILISLYMYLLKNVLIHMKGSLMSIHMSLYVHVSIHFQFLFSQLSILER